MWILVLKLSVRNMATNFVAHVTVIALPQYGKPASERFVVWEKKHAIAPLVEEA